MARVDPVQQLHMAAISERAGLTVGSDRLIQAALDAVLAGVDSQALNELAGLGRSEESEAHDLLELVVDELGLGHSLPADPTTARWELVRWWCRQIVDGELLPEIGCDLIWFDGYEALGHPRALEPLVDLARTWEILDEPDERLRAYRDHMIAIVEELLAQPWPPGRS